VLKIRDLILQALKYFFVSGHCPFRSNLKHQSTLLSSWGLLIHNLRSQICHKTFNTYVYIPIVAFITLATAFPALHLNRSEATIGLNKAADSITLEKRLTGSKN